MKLYEVLSPDGLQNAVTGFLFGKTTESLRAADKAIYQYMSERYDIQENITQSICVHLLRTKNLPLELKKRLRGSAVPASETFWRDKDQMYDEIDKRWSGTPNHEVDMLKVRQGYAYLYKVFLRVLASRGIQ